MEKRPAKQSAILKFAITGPESTGKSSLTRLLAVEFHVPFVKEFARNFLTERGGKYKEDDLLHIAQQQKLMEKKCERKAPSFMFCDTELIVVKIWSQVKFGRCNPTILKWIEEQNYKHYFLCDIDIPWEDDPLREHPTMRKELFEMYLYELNYYGFPYTIISGKHDQRLLKVVNVVNSIINYA